MSTSNPTIHYPQSLESKHNFMTSNPRCTSFYCDIQIKELPLMAHCDILPCKNTQNSRLVKKNCLLIQSQMKSLLVSLYPLVNMQKTMENHHFQWVNPLFLWPFSIAMFDITRGYPLWISPDSTKKTRCGQGANLRNSGHATLPALLKLFAD